jgi:hypothetical protein
LITYVLVTTFVTGLLTVGGLLVTVRWLPDWGMEVLFVAAGINLIAGWVSFVPLMVVQRRHREYLPQAALSMTAMRILLAGSALLALLAWGSWDDWSLSIWTLGFYLPLLAVETFMAVRVVKRFDGQGAKTAR